MIIGHRRLDRRDCQSRDRIKVTVKEASPMARFQNKAQCGRGNRAPRAKKFAARWHLYSIRSERRGADQRRRHADRYPRFWSGGARAADKNYMKIVFPGAGSYLIAELKW